MFGFMVVLSIVFFYYPPKLTCFFDNYEQNLSKTFSCTVSKACEHENYFQFDFNVTYVNFLTTKEDLCRSNSYDFKILFNAVVVGLVCTFMITGILMDRFGRKKIIAFKIVLSIVFLFILVLRHFMMNSNYL